MIRCFCMDSDQLPGHLPINSFVLYSISCVRGCQAKKTIGDEIEPVGMTYRID
jgi:hypothetical protein